MKGKIILIVVAIVVVVGALVYRRHQKALAEANSQFASGNGRLEATEISISAKLAGRIDEIMVDEGDFVKENQPLVQMQLNVLNAQLAQAEAKKNQAKTSEASAIALIAVRESEVSAAKAVVAQKKSIMEGAEKRYGRTKSLHQKEVVSDQKFDDDEAEYLSAKAAYESAQAEVKQAEAAVAVAKADAEGAKAAVLAADADIACIKADIDDSLLVSPRKGRIQYRIAQKGEVLSAGGRVLNLIDLTDVYMTFYLPERIAGKVAIGTEVRIVLDAIPEYPTPATVSYVASSAQFTPKTVETQEERQKLMFRVKARIAPELLERYIEYVKTGLPGVAWVKLDPNAEWPEHLKTELEKTGHPVIPPTEKTTDSQK
jgi:HlyD family secretion protein